MNLAIDLRFFSLESYGLAVQLKELLPFLLPKLLSNAKISKITLILDGKLAETDLSLHFEWWSITQDPRITLIYSYSKYYSVGEQTQFLKLLNSLKPDLTYFFNFNFPILYKRPFIYNVLDLTLVKRSGFDPKLLIMKQVLKQGLSRAEHVFFLGEQTKMEAEKFLGRPINNSSLIYNGVNKLFLQQGSANFSKAKVTGLAYDETQAQASDLLLAKLKINKPYFLFVSVWKSHKNIERLVEAFEKFQNQNQNKFQLILVGSADPKNPDAIARVNDSPQFALGNLIATGKVSENDLIRLQDGARAFVFPSLSEGFGLGLVEAASRGTLVVCSDIPVFADILLAARLKFNPLSVEEIANSMQTAVDLDDESYSQITTEAARLSQKYRWQDQAEIIATNINRIFQKSK